jgi:glutamate-1-semialdehyde 2,1-aminomutase
MRLEMGMPSTGQTLYRRARKIMPGGTQLLSKRPEIFLPEHVADLFQVGQGG